MRTAFNQQREQVGVLNQAYATPHLPLREEGQLTQQHAQAKYSCCHQTMTLWTWYGGTWPWTTNWTDVAGQEQTGGQDCGQLTLRSGVWQDN